VRELVEGIAVVGSGVAGLTLSAALGSRRVPVELIGARVGGLIARGGAADDAFDRGIHLWPRAMAALERIGLLAPLAARGSRIERLRLWSSTGRVLAEVASREALEVAGGVAVRASALVDVLLAGCAGVDIDTGRRALGYSEDEHGVALTFDGGWPLRAPLVVGADGASSAIRMQCLDDGPPVYSGDSVWEGIASGVDMLPPGTLDFCWGAHGLRGGALSMGEAGDTAWWLDVETGVGGALEGGGTKAELVHLLSDVRGPLPELVAATPAAAIRRADVLARRGGPAAGRGRVTLIGDAAHALPITLRLGASLAIEDAVALADTLVAQVNPVEALRLYERAREAELAHVEKMLWRLRALEVRQSALASRARDRWVASLSGPTLVRYLRELVSVPLPSQ
jgi:2-polyprenyl-6-methoxyphenol hydroxylase-like FAD-dependent oxidoreductase